MARTEAQKRADKNYRLKNKEKILMTTIKSNAKRFITLATLEELTEIEKLIEKRKEEL